MTSSEGTPVDGDAVWAALATVNDPEIRRPLVELGMVRAVDIQGDHVTVTVLLTISGCPMRATITEDITRAVSAVPHVGEVAVTLDVMTDEQRAELRALLVGRAEREIPFAKAGSLTRVIAVASGKGGVGKSSVTVNLAAALAAQGASVGLVDADVYGHSIPRLLGLDTPPTYVDGLFMPPQIHGVRVMSILPFKPGGVTEPVAYRGPMLHKVLQQFLADTWWGDLDYLVMDLPPGTGDMPMSIGQTLPNSEVVIVTTAHQSAAEVAVRSGMLAHRLRQRIVGVIENMSYTVCPACGERSPLFGSGGADLVSSLLHEATGNDIPVVGRIPYDSALADPQPGAAPIVLAAQTSPAADELRLIAQTLASRPRGLVGMPLAVSPSGR